MRKDSLKYEVMLLISTSDIQEGKGMEEVKHHLGSLSIFLSFQPFLSLDGSVSLISFSLVPSSIQKFFFFAFKVQKDIIALLFFSFSVI